MSAKSPVLKMRDILTIANSQVKWKVFEDLSHDFVNLYFTPSSAPAALSQRTLPRGCIDTLVSGNEAESMNYNGSVIPDTSIFFGKKSALRQPGSNIDKTNALLCLEYTKEKDLSKYLIRNEKLLHAYNMGKAMALRKKDAGLRTSGELIYKSWESIPDSPDPTLPEIPIVLVISSRNQERDNFPDASELQEKLEMHHPNTKISESSAEHAGGYTIIDENGETIAYLGIITHREWVDICTTMLALSGAPSQRLFETMDRIVWEMSCCGLGPESAFKLHSIDVSDARWSPSRNQTPRGSNIKFQAGAVLGVQAFFGVDKKTLAHNCTVPRTVANSEKLQRPLDEKHLISMANSISQNKQLPGILTLFSNAEVLDDEDFDGHKLLYEKVGDSDRFRPYSIEVIDGQHRLFSHYWTGSESQKCDVLIYYRVSGDEDQITDAKAELFYDINYKSKTPSKLLALFHSTKFDDLSANGWVSKNSGKRRSTASYDKDVNTPVVHAYSFLLELNNHYPFKGLFEDHGLGTMSFPLSTIAGYISPFFDFGIDKAGDIGTRSIHKIATGFPDAKENRIGEAPDGWFGVSPVHLAESGWYRRAAKRFIVFLSEIGFSKWYDDTEPHNVPDWISERGITNRNYSDKEWGAYLRHHLENAPKTSMLSTLLLLWIYRNGNPGTSTSKSIWSKMQTSLADPKLSRARENLRDLLQDSQIYKEFTGFNAVNYPVTEAMKKWNQELPNNSEGERYKIKQFNFRDHDKGIRSIIPSAQR